MVFPFVSQSRSVCELLGIDIEEKSVPLALYFAGVNISYEELKGNTIEGSQAELSYILEDIHTDYEERTILAKGVKSQPVFGHPDRPIEYVECSLESQNVINSTSLLNSVNHRYTVNPDIDTDTSLNYNTCSSSRNNISACTLPVLDSLAIRGKYTKGLYVPFRRCNSPNINKGTSLSVAIASVLDVRAVQ